MKKSRPNLILEKRRGEEERKPEKQVYERGERSRGKTMRKLRGRKEGGGRRWKKGQNKI